MQRREDPHILVQTIEWFTRQEAAGGLLLLASAAAALIWANSPIQGLYTDLWQTTITIDLGVFEVSKSLLLWVNDGLMAIFFFVIGLEIKREVLVGELSSPRQAALPLVAAVGGMVVPAACYAAVTWNTPALSGWGIPMATDIAFALGVLALLGERAPLALKVFLTALAIVDDLGAVLVIALFYTAKISWTALGVGALFLLGLILINRLGVRGLLLYVVLAVGLWVAVLKSGVHATIAGVLAALTIPARRKIDTDTFLKEGNSLMDLFAEESTAETPDPTDEQQNIIHALEEACEDVQTPLTRMEHNLHPWVVYFILPLFALANAGVLLSGEMLSAAFGSALTLGIILGLVLGKQIGVTLFAWMSVKVGWAALPGGITWRDIYGVAWLTGIGFTMSLFIGGLAFTDPLLLDSAKIGIIAASLISGLGGWAILRSSSV